MTTPYRVPCPPEVEAPEVEHPYARVIRAERRRARLLAGGAIAATLAVTAGFASARSARADAKRAEEARVQVETVVRATRERAEALRADLAVARDRAVVARARFERGMEEARANGGAGLGTCPADVLGGGPSVVSVVEPAAHAIPSRVVEDTLADARRAELHVDARRFDTAAAYAAALRSERRWNRELVVVATASRPPRLSSEHTYEPGEVEGRVYLWDHQAGRVLCAADVHATSSREIDFTYAYAPDARAEAGRTPRLLASLEEDLAKSLEHAAVNALRATR